MEIANALCESTGCWLRTHNRSIMISDLRAMKLMVTNFNDDPNLGDAIVRYHALLQMTFASSIFKVYETPTSQIMKVEPQPDGRPGAARIEERWLFRCDAVNMPTMRSFPEDSS